MGKEFSKKDQPRWDTSLLKKFRPKRRLTFARFMLTLIGGTFIWMLMAFILGLVLTSFCFGVYFAMEFFIELLGITP